VYDLERWLHAGFIGAVIGILHQLQDNVVVLVVQLLAQQPGSIGNCTASHEKEQTVVDEMLILRCRLPLKGRLRSHGCWQ
jgi:hypothetical protein